MSQFNSYKHYNDSSAIMQGGEAEKAADFANYFCSYAYLYHQKQMLMDHNRMKAYHDAIKMNRHLFEGKTVLDVGTGSGVLSIWCAQAGAAKVYAIEFTDMANHARELVKSNGLSNIVEVIQSSAEDIELPCQVDVIVSEWMGYFLLRESMLDSVIRVRDKWLKPGGCMFPSHATMLMSAICFEDDRESKKEEYNNSMKDWQRFLYDMQRYSIDMSVLSAPYQKEQIDYYIFSSLWTELSPEHVIGEPVVLREFDLNTCTLKDVEGLNLTGFQVKIPYPCTISGFAGWFTVDFNGSPANPVSHPVRLTTGPEGGYTHWGQQVFYLPDAVEAAPGSTVQGTVEMIRQEKNQRLYNLRLHAGIDNHEIVKAIYEIP